MVGILDNPVITDAIERRQELLRLAARHVEHLIDTTPWRDKSASQRKLCIAHTVSQVETKEELERRLQEDFGVYACIDWYLPEPSDQAGAEARAFGQAIGGLVSKNGAMVMIMT